jgi:16S rRNA (guanine966-N2)-methyltransferase
MRIVGGELRGRALHAPPGFDVRPTSDRVREALFNILEHGTYPLRGARVLDLFAGTGALGLEAISRGAGFALFVEDSASARAAIRRNIEGLQLTGRTRIYRRDATQLSAIPAGTKPFDLVFLDPPYAKRLSESALESARSGGWLTEDCFIIVEAHKGVGFDKPQLFSLIDEREYGETKLSFLTRLAPHRRAD